MPITYGSVCSGIEAASVAWEPMGWIPAWFAEIDPFASAVLSHRWPGVENLGDFTTIEADAGSIDVLVGGTPCQSFSVAGLRGGLADDRGNLALEFLRLAQRTRPLWVVWENVPGVLSSNRGRDFGTFLGGLAELGYGWSYRILDAQHFGIPQRRRRVFVVGYLGDWRRAVAVLLERHSLSGNPPPRREEGEGIARSLKGGARGGGGQSSSDDQETVIACNAVGFETYGHSMYREGIGPLRRKGGDAGDGSETLIAHTLRADGFDASEDGTGRGTPLVAIDFRNMTEGDVAQTLQVGGHGTSPSNHPHVMQPIPIDMRQASRGETMTNNRREGSSGGAPGIGVGEPGDPSPSISLSHPPAVAFAWQGGGKQTSLGYDPVSGTVQTLGVKQLPAIVGRSAVRRLTPRECERLQGFPDDYTLVPYRGKPASDGPRYKAIGNSMAVPAMRWIGQRIATVNKRPTTS